MKYRTIALVFLSILLASGLVSAAKTVDLDYLEDDYLVIESPTAEVIFDSSTRLSTDLNIFKITNTTTLTLFYVKSNNISSDIDYTFVNDTKLYNYTVLNHTENLQIRVNYSSLPIPYSYVTELEEEIAYLNDLINALNQTISQLQQNNTYLEQNVTQKNQTIQNLQDDLTNAIQKRDNAINLKNTYEQENQQLVQNNTELVNEKQNLANMIGNLSDDIDSKNQVINNLKNTINEQDDSLDEKKETISQLESIFTITYQKGKVGGIIHFNIFNLVLGGIIFLGIYILYQRQSSYGRKTLLDTISDSVSSIPIVGSAKRRTPEEWNQIEEMDNEIPDVEKEMLRDQEDDEEEEEETEEESEPEPEEKPKKKKSSKKKKKTDYWDTPAGRKRKEQMSKAAKGRL